MKRFLLCFIALPLIASAQVRSLGVFLDFPQSPNSKAVLEMKKEVGSLLKNSGLNLQWRALAENRGTEGFDHLVVVHFKGRCISLPSAAGIEDALPFRETVTLASTVVRDGRVLPYSEINCDRIRGSLGSRVYSFGRALGVVVAHELQHILGNTVRHAKVGWMRRALDWKDLTRKREGQGFLPLR